MANYKSAWMSIEDAAKVLNCSPKDIEMLINVTMVADIRNSGEKLVNPKEIRSFLGKARVLADKLSNSPKVEPKTKEEHEYVGGKEAAEKLDIPYDVFIKRCEDKIIPGEKRGRGWRIEKSKLDELIKAKEEPIIITRLFDPRTANPDPDSLAGPHTTLILRPPDEGTGESEEKKGDTSPILLPEDPPDNEDVQPLEDYKPEALPKQGRNSYSVRARKRNKGEYCRIDEVAKGLNMPIDQIRRWIIDKQVEFVEEIEQAKSILYIEKESLRTFLKKYNIDVNFDTY